MQNPFQQFEDELNQKRLCYLAGPEGPSEYQSEQEEKQEDLSTESRQSREQGEAEKKEQVEQKESAEREEVSPEQQQEKLEQVLKTDKQYGEKLSEFVGSENPTELAIAKEFVDKPLIDAFIQQQTELREKADANRKELLSGIQAAISPVEQRENKQ